jgi:hypothetical protein
LPHTPGAFIINSQNVLLTGLSSLSPELLSLPGLSGEDTPNLFVLIKKKKKKRVQQPCPPSKSNNVSNLRGVQVSTSLVPARGTACLSVISCFGALLTVTAAGLGRAPGRLSASAEQAGAPRPAPRARQRAAALRSREQCLHNCLGLFLSSRDTFCRSCSTRKQICRSP